MPVTLTKLPTTLLKDSLDHGLLKRRKITVDPDASGDSIRDSGVVAKSVRAAETVDGVVSNAGTLAGLAARIPSAPAMLGRIASGASRAAPVMATLQAVDGARLLSPEYRGAATASLQNMQDKPSRLDTSYFNTSAAMQGLGRAPSTIFALGAALAEPAPEPDSPIRDTRPIYNAERERRLREIPKRTLTQPLGEVSAARKFFRIPRP